VSVLLRLETEGGWDVVLRHKREWTCRLHDYPEPLDEHGEVPFFELGCSCFTRAEWVDLDELELVCDGPLSKLLRTYYLPGVKRQLEEEVKFLDLHN
jgi:hypothetical protein